MSAISFQCVTKIFNIHVFSGFKEALERWREEGKIPLDEQSVSIIVTDDVGFANNASETNDIVILLSDNEPEGKSERVIVSWPDGRRIFHDLSDALLEFNKKPAN